MKYHVYDLSCGRELIDVCETLEEAERAKALQEKGYGGEHHVLITEAHE